MLGETIGVVVLAAILLGAYPALAHHVVGGQMPTNFADGLLSGLGHPIIGIDHLAAVIVVGCLAATQPRGARLVVAYVIAMLLGAWAHVGEATVAGSEIFVALSVVALGVVAFRTQPLRADLLFALFAGAGLVHGYALGESIAGAEATPLYAYFVGLVIIQSAIALGAMVATGILAKKTAIQPTAIRLVGAAAIAVGLSVLLQQFLTGA